MKVSRKMRGTTFFPWRGRRRGNGMAHEYASNEPPLRAALLSADQMAQHGKTLAGSHRLGLERAPDRLLTRLAENEVVLIDVCNLLTEALTADRRIAPAGEWLLDNFYLIEDQIRTAKRHLPKRYSRELPRLASGPSAGLPRVYDMALETISHGDGRVDAEGLSGFVAAYQTVSVLQLGELWAIPIMLRLALIENLRRVAARMAAGRIDRNRADYWADQMTEMAEKDPKSLILVIADMARSNPPMGSEFVAEFARRLQGQSPALALPLTWIEQRLAESSSLRPSPMPCTRRSAILRRYTYIRRKPPAILCTRRPRSEDSYYDLPRQSEDAGSLYEHCTRAILHGLRFGTHGLPLIGSGDWNDGMNRSANTAQAKVSGWDSSSTMCSRDSPTSPGSVATSPSPNAARRRHHSYASTSSRAPGTARGIAAPPSTTARRSGRRPTPNARSIPSRKAGRCSLALAIPSARVWRWTRWISASSVATRHWSSSWIRRSIRPRCTLATSRATSLACARMAASTPIGDLDRHGVRPLGR